MSEKIAAQERAAGMRGSNPFAGEDVSRRAINLSAPEHTGVGGGTATDSINWSEYNESKHTGEDEKRASTDEMIRNQNAAKDL